MWYFVGGGAAYMGGGSVPIDFLVSIGVLLTAGLKQLIGIYSLIPTMIIYMTFLSLITIIINIFTVPYCCTCNFSPTNSTVILT